MNVYGRFRASLTIHMDVSFPGYGVHQKIRRNRVCLQFLPKFSETRTTILESSPVSFPGHVDDDETARSHLFFVAASWKHTLLSLLRRASPHMAANP